MLQTAIEAEVTEFFGRDRYQRGERDREGYRNGYSEVTIRSTAGPIVLARPKVRGTAEAFCSRLLGVAVARSNALEALVISSFVRGLSVRDCPRSPPTPGRDSSPAWWSGVSARLCSWSPTARRG